ncbi:MAG: FAD-dependent oxidoreductase [Collinsella sp.]
MREETDVLVIGGGIAGIVSSIEAARAGANVTIACAGPLFGGSSFYPGTWGLGLIGPADEEDEADLIATIENVGCGVADPTLVETFVHNIRPAIEWLEQELGVPLERPLQRQERAQVTFIPCFDHTNRLWRGIKREAFERVARAEIERLGIELLERCELMEIVRDQHGPVIGAILYDRREQELFPFPARVGHPAPPAAREDCLNAVSTSRDVLSSAHGIALDAGCSLVNIEFMQMMPGLVSPARGIVFNEKTFRYAVFEDPAGILPADRKGLSDLLEARSGHGPFTCRLGDELVDMAIDAAGEDGIAVHYNFPKDDAPEFVQTFAQWMEDELGITPNDELRVAMYAHAANGGIRIDAHAKTSVPGLFACGEVTGGMHGADRIGGLSSANGLVFGRIAGKGAANQGTAASTCINEDRILKESIERIRMNAAPLDDMDASRITKDMQGTMERACHDSTDRRRPCNGTRRY